ncbi:MAG: hypothetical protein COA47_03545 [Robiginitomaculum sp.]|nr:MAG: hypothetical protein COA47_03545 [Robiginitomaculum sp.]
MGILKFLFREGSSFIFGAFIVLFAMRFFSYYAWPEDALGMFAFSAFCMAYLAMQMGLAAFAKVGHDGPVVDLFLSIIPLIALIVIAVLQIVEEIPLSMFQMYALGLAAIVVLMDITFNTLILFKMNRLANDYVQMK